MAEKQVKTPEQKAKEKTIQKMLAFISAKTFSRHAFLSEADYVKEIGYEGEKEDVAINKSLANLMSDFSVTQMRLKSHLERMIGTIALAEGKSVEEIIEGGEKNGK